MQAAIPNVHIPTESIRAFCKRWQIKELALFGSVLSDDFTANSDVDVLLTFDEGSQLRLIQITTLADELETLFGRKVDVMTRKSIENSPNYLRRQLILESARVLYAE